MALLPETELEFVRARQLVPLGNRFALCFEIRFGSRKSESGAVKVNAIRINNRNHHGDAT